MRVPTWLDQEWNPHREGIRNRESRPLSTRPWRSQGWLLLLLLCDYYYVIIRAPDKVHIFVSIIHTSPPNSMYDHLLELSHRNF